MNIRFRTSLYEAPNDGGAPPPGGGAAPPPPPAPAVAWLPDVNDADTIGHVQNKAWQSPLDAVKAHRALESLLGADRAGRTFTIPKDEADADGWAQVWNKLGRPENAEGYQLPVPEGQADTFAKQAAGWFHEAGVPKGMAQKLAAKWNEFATAQEQEAAAAEQQALADEHKALEKDWGTGQAAALQKEVARRAATKLGLDEAAIGALEKVVGFSKVMKAFAKMGELMGEHKGEGMGEGLGLTLTPEAARSRRSQLMADPQWRGKAMNPQSAEWAELQKLDRILSAAAEQTA